MNLFFPPEQNSGSKANWVLDALREAHPDAASWIGQAHWDPRITGVYWSLGFVYGPNIRRAKREGAPYIFTDMPYWNRWMGNNRGTCHWRIIPRALHCNWIEDRPGDRFQKLGIKLHDWRKNGNHILVCPSSISMENFHEIVGWTQRTVGTLKQYTDRPIKIRQKPRKLNRSGPMVADIPFEEDCKNAWAVVTSFSIAGVEAATLGVPVFSHPEGPCAQLGNTDLSMIEQPTLADREPWVNTLAYYQYTEDEIRKGYHRPIIEMT